MPNPDHLLPGGGMSSASPLSEIDAYIAQFPEPIRLRLAELRSTIREIVPEASEKISYGMPTFFLRKNLVHFAGYERHIGFYPTPAGITSFSEELARYKQGKGSVQFPHSEPLPLDLIRRIVQFRAEENLQEKP